MKSQFLVKIITLTVLASSSFIPSEAKAQSGYSYSQSGNEVLREYINRRRDEIEQLQGEIGDMRQERIIESLTY